MRAWGHPVAECQIIRDILQLWGPPVAEADAAEQLTTAAAAAAAGTHC